MSTVRLLQDFAVKAFGDERAGDDLAEIEIERLQQLGEALAAALTHWRDLTGPVWRLRPLEPSRAGVIILETVFDEVLDGPRWRALAKAFADACR